MVVGQYGTVDVFHTGQGLRSPLCIYFGSLHYKPQMSGGKEIGEFR